MSFTGFSEDDIKKFKNPSNKSENVIQRAKVKKVTGTIKTQKRDNSKKVTFEIIETPNNCDNICVPNKNTTTKVDLPHTNTELNSNPDIAKESPTVLNNNVNEEVNQVGKKIIDLDEFEARQKLIEEQNRKRKELLSKALADRTKQTQEETERLGEIQNEFKKLDAILSNDVQIIRKQIEVACLDYMEAQKKYDRIEKEFLEAKFSLFQKVEKKQMLTEHLCTIIEKNEERKAEKLTELLQKLNVDPMNITNENILNETDSFSKENILNS